MRKKLTLFKGIQGQFIGAAPHPNNVADNLAMASGYGRFFVTSDDGYVIGLSSESDGEDEKEPE